MTTLSGDYGPGVLIRQNSGGPIEYSYDYITWNTLSFPCTLTKGTGSTFSIFFTTDITLTTPNDYFEIASDNIQIGSGNYREDGTIPIITIDSVSNYPGLVKNGERYVNGYNSIEIRTLQIVISGSSTLLTGGGWFGQFGYSYGAINNLINNCSTTAPIPASCGGIVGQHTAGSSGYLIIEFCYSTNTIGDGAGGIVATRGAETNGTILINNCFSSGSMGLNSGGIIANRCAVDNGTIIIENCYSTGSIGTAAGGIIGANAAGQMLFPDGQITINQCYSTGSIGNSAGGIVGNVPVGTVAVTKCYSTGTIGTSAGGVFGAGANDVNKQSAFNCYTSGTGVGNGIFSGDTNDNRTNSINNYSELNNSSSGWNDVNVSSRFTGTPTTTAYGSTWCQPDGPNTAYKLSSSSAYSPYSIFITNTISGTVTAGESTNGGVIPGFTYSLLEINGVPPASEPTITITDSTGAINTTTGTAAGTYTIYVFATKNPYSVTTYTLTVSSGGGGGSGSGEEVTCCDRPMNLVNVDYSERNQFVAGNTMIADTSVRRSAYSSYSELLRLKMAYAAKLS